MVGPGVRLQDLVLGWVEFLQAAKGTDRIGGPALSFHQDLTGAPEHVSMGRTPRKDLIEQVCMIQSPRVLVGGQGQFHRPQAQDGVHRSIE